MIDAAKFDGTEMSLEDRLLSMERRNRVAASVWGELVVENAWRPSDKPKAEEGWLRAKGYLPERRTR